MRVELLLNSGLPFRRMAVGMRLKMKLCLAQLADAKYRDVVGTLDDSQIAFCHSFIVTQSDGGRKS